MSIDHNVYVGPFIIAMYYPKEILRESSGLYCSDEYCDNKKCIYPPNKYCAICGSTCKPKNVPYKDSPDWFELIGDNPLTSWNGELENAVSCNFDCPPDMEYDVLILNTRSILDREDLHINAKIEMDFVDLDKINIEEEKSELLLICKEEIEILKQHYHGILVKWGVLVWSS